MCIRDRPWGTLLTTSVDFRRLHRAPWKTYCRCHSQQLAQAKSAHSQASQQQLRSKSNDAGMYKACAKQQDVKTMARHRCINRPPPARLEQTALVNDFAHKECSARPGRQVAPRRLDVGIACKMASMMLRKDDTAGLFRAFGIYRCRTPTSLEVHPFSRIGRSIFDSKLV